MFSELKFRFENSQKERADLIAYADSLHTMLMEAADLSGLLKESIVKDVVISSEGIFIELRSGIKLYINDNDRGEVPMTCLVKGDYETEETKMVLKILNHCKDKDEFTMLDIGANVGWYTLNVMQQYPSMKVYSFEPSPVTYNRLKRNLELNNFTTEGLVNAGLYSEKGELSFYYNAEESGCSSFVNLREKEDISQIYVKVVTLDDWVKQNRVQRVDFIKCDVEGSELFVYRGGGKTIKKYCPIVFSEMLRKWSAKFNYHPNDIINFFKEMGYECFVIKGNGLAPIAVVTEETVETNYFFLHKEKHEKLILSLLNK